MALGGVEYKFSVDVQTVAVHLKILLGSGCFFAKVALSMITTSPKARYWKQMEEVSDGTLKSSRTIEEMCGKLLDEVRQAYNFARHTFQDLDEDQLKQAYLEARRLAESQLFGGELYPEVSVDPYGEFTFSHRSDAGYADIGVRGEGELSYHVRNDKVPQETKFDDHDWRDHHIPQDLFKALKALREHL